MRDYRVSKRTGCWNWQKALNDKGYGRISVGGVEHKAHRYYYEQHMGAIPDGLVVDHLCSNRRCVNPEHLEPVTQAENVRRGRAHVHAPETVQHIRRLHAGGMNHCRIARAVGVPRSSVQAICSGKRWSGV